VTSYKCIQGTRTPPVAKVLPVLTPVVTTPTPVTTVKDTPVQTQTCWDGSVIPTTQSCPAQTKTCPNGSTIPVSQTCAMQTQTCSDGSVIAVTSSCPAVVSAKILPAAPASVPAPINLQASNIASNSITLSWTNPVSYSTCFVYYGTDYDTVNNYPGTGNAGGCTPMNIPGLAAGTAYYFKVKGAYNGSYSAWSDVLTTTTTTNTVRSPKLLPASDLSPTVYGANSYQFARSLDYGMHGDDVVMLQKFLNTQGSKLDVTGYYGNATKAAVKAFQEAHKIEILDKQNLTEGSGDFFFNTLSFVNDLLLKSTTINLNN
jgi:hypothetical protein